MKFKIEARVISHLGEALISSDEVAIFELVKNGFDAGSKRVDVNINFQLPLQKVTELQKEALILFYAGKGDEQVPDDLMSVTLKKINALKSGSSSDCQLTIDQIASYSSLIKSSYTTAEFLQNIGSVNFIEIKDSGHGMTLEEVENIFLTVGTKHRYRQIRELGEDASDVPAGEKGIGRLSAMRLGKVLHLKTLAKEATDEVNLTINWRDFDAEFDKEASEIDIKHKLVTNTSGGSGTTIRIDNLTSSWVDREIKALVDHQLAKFMNPFVDKRKRLRVRYNGSVLDIGSLNRVYIENCVNYFKFTVSFNESNHAQIDTSFKLGGLKNTPVKKYSRMFTTNDFESISDADLREIGPFEVELYHYPRNKIKSIPGVATASEVKRNWLDHWCGGLMIFRDDIRVLPYAEKQDDWLDLDDSALRGKGFRVNRIQVVGCIHLSRMKNPMLVDQTNREGLQNNKVFRSFKSFVNLHIRQNFVRAINEALDNEKSDLMVLTADVARESDSLIESLDAIQKAINEKSWTDIEKHFKFLEKTSKELIGLNNIVEKALQDKVNDKLQVFELAATGLAAESIVHDLEGVIGTAMNSLSNLKESSLDSRMNDSIRHIRAVHSAILKQVQLISPSPAKTRRRRSKIDILKLIKESARFYQARLKRHGIHLSINTEKTFYINVVEGHLKQILDNLFRNSFTWLTTTVKKYPSRNLAINIVLDPVSKTLCFSDSGVGIDPIDAEWVFAPFNTRRETGRGLGLHICRELSEFNKIKIHLDLQDKNEWGRLRTIVLGFID